MATPIWASIINLVNLAPHVIPLCALTQVQINEDRLAAKKSPVGFINPALYGNTWVFNDITEGYNNGCGLKVGFEAQPGYVICPQVVRD